MKTLEQDRRDVAEILEQYRSGWAALDAAKLGGIWDQSYDGIIYVPLEAARPLRGWTAVERYYVRVAVFLRARVMTISDVSVDVFGDTAYAFCTFHFEGEINGKEHAADGRNTFVLRRTAQGWKVIHYHESAPGSLQLGG